jgi:hypothetical protein
MSRSFIVNTSTVCVDPTVSQFDAPESLEGAVDDLLGGRFALAGDTSDLRKWSVFDHPQVYRQALFGAEGCKKLDQPRFVLGLTRGHGGLLQPR